MYNYQCQACRKRHGRKSGALGLHHIIPVDQNGPDTIDNLVLICKSCHDQIELDWKKYNTYNAIAYSFCMRKPKKKSGKQGIGADWRQWVYGGRRNPLYDKWPQSG